MMVTVPSVATRIQALGARLIVGLGAGSDERRHQRGTLHFGDRLGKHLVEVLDGAQHARVIVDQPAIVPDRLIHQHQRAQLLFERCAQQIHQQRFGRHREALVMAFQSGVADIAGQLVGQRAPEGADAARLALRAVDLQPFLHVELIAGQQRHARTRGLRQARERQELADRLVVGQGLAPLG